MLLRRISPAEKVVSEIDRSDSPLLKEPGRTHSRPRLLNSEDVPTWYAHNAYIRTGYRPVTPSALLCFRSLAYLHNETVNIYSHLIPAMVAFIFILRLFFPTSILERSARTSYLSNNVDDLL